MPHARPPWEILTRGGPTDKKLVILDETLAAAPERLTDAAQAIATVVEPDPDAPATPTTPQGLRTTTEKINVVNRHIGDGSLANAIGYALWINGEWLWKPNADKDIASSTADCGCLYCIDDGMISDCALLPIDALEVYTAAMPGLQCCDNATPKKYLIHDSGCTWLSDTWTCNFYDQARFRLVVEATWVSLIFEISTNGNAWVERVRYRRRTNEWFALCNNLMELDLTNGLADCGGEQCTVCVGPPYQTCNVCPDDVTAPGWNVDLDKMVNNNYSIVTMGPRSGVECEYGWGSWIYDITIYRLGLAYNAIPATQLYQYWILVFNIMAGGYSVFSPYASFVNMWACHRDKWNCIGPNTMDYVPFSSGMNQVLINNFGNDPVVWWGADQNTIHAGQTVSIWPTLPPPITGGGFV